MYKQIRKFLFITLVALCSIYFSNISYASVDIRATSVAEYGHTSAPYSAIRIEIANSGDKIEGTLKVEVFENSKSIYDLIYPIYVYAQSTQYKDIKINLNGNTNDILISLIDGNGNTISTHDFLLNKGNYISKLNVGIISAGPVIDHFEKSISNLPSDMCEIVMIDEEKYYENSSLFNNIDILIISDISMQNASSFFSEAIYNFTINGGIVYVLYKELGAFSFIDEFVPYLGNLDLRQNSAQQNIDVGQGIVIVRSDGFYDLWVEGTSANAYTKNFIDLTLNLDKISQIKERKLLLKSDADMDTNKLLERDSTLGMPNIYLHYIIIIVFILLIGAIPFFLSRKFMLFKIFNVYAVIVSAVFVVFVVALNITYSSYRVIKNQTNIVIADQNITKEVSYVTLRFPYAGNYSFDAGSDTEIIPVLEENEIVPRNIQDSNVKRTTIISGAGNTSLDINNKEVYSKNSFYITREYDNVYRVSFDASFYDDKFVGSIDNATSKELKNVIVASSDKYIVIGSIPSNESVELTNYNSITMPVNDGKYISNIAFKDNPEFFKMYLDLNSEKSSDNIYLFFNLYDAIEPNLTGDDISQSTGNTAFVYKTNLGNNLARRDISLLNCNMNIVQGTYDKLSNTILGNEEVVVEYSLDSQLEYSKLYMNQIDNKNFDSDLNIVPFKGNIYLYNYASNSYDLILAHAILSPRNYISPGHSMRVRYVPSNVDEKYRKMYLTYFRIIGDNVRQW